MKVFIWLGYLSMVTVPLFCLEVSVERGTALTMNPDFNEYGNPVLLRTKHLGEFARRSWVDLDTELPAGTLLFYYLHTHNLSQTTNLSTSDVRLQLWRPQGGKETEMLLAWQAVVTVSTTHKEGALYKVNVTDPYDPIHVQAGDRIGWGLDDLGVITLDPKDGHRTAYRSETENTMAEVGQTYEFATLYWPSMWSVGVKVIPEIIQPIPRPTTTPQPTTTTTTMPTTTTTEPTTTAEATTTEEATTEMETTAVQATNGPVISPTKSMSSLYLNPWNVYGPIIGVAVAAVVGSILVIIVYKWKQHQSKSVTPQFIA